MRFQQVPLRPRLLIAAGLLMALLPNLFAEYLKLPDFFHGGLIGVGLGLEYCGFILLRRWRRAGSSC